MELGGGGVDCHVKETTYIMCGVDYGANVAEIICRAILSARVNVNGKYSEARLHGPRISGQCCEGTIW